MVIEFTCTCGKSMKCKEELAGRRAKCKDCGKRFVIPGGTTGSEDFLQVESARQGGKPLSNPTRNENPAKRPISERECAVPGGTPMRPSNQSDTGVVRAAMATMISMIKCECGQHFTWDPQLAGRYSQCNGCGRVFLIPGEIVDASLPNFGIDVSSPEKDEFSLRKSVKAVPPASAFWPLIVAVLFAASAVFYVTRNQFTHRGVAGQATLNERTKRGVAVQHNESPKDDNFRLPFFGSASRCPFKTSRVPVTFNLGILQYDLKITCISDRPVVITNAICNHKEVAYFTTLAGIGRAVDLPAKLEIGESLYTIVQDNRPYGAHAEVISLEIYTDQGVFSFAPND